MSKKFIIGASIALALILGGGIGYYYWNQTSADIVTRDFCTGTTGRGWKNCVANAVVLRGELARDNSARFKTALQNADTLRTYVPGKIIVTPPVIPAIPVKPADQEIGGALVPNPVVGCAGVTVYTSASFVGTGICLDPGSYNVTALTGKGIANNTIKSIKVPTGHLATIYQDENFSYDNDSMAIMADKTGLTAPVEDSVSSIRVYGTCAGATVFSSKNYTGDSQRVNDMTGGYLTAGFGICLPVGSYNMTALANLGVADNLISSIKVATDKQVTVYEKSDLTGTTMAVLTTDTTDLSTLSPSMNDNISSLKVE